MLIALLLVLTALPFLVLLAQALSPVVPILFTWQGIAPVLINTLVLVAGTCLCCGVLGTGFAYVTTRFRLPAQGFWSLALLLPLAVPKYVMAFIFSGLLAYAGPLQTLSRAVLGTSSFFPTLQSVGGGIFVLTLTLFPYVFLLAREGFMSQGSRSIEVAQSLGLSPWATFWRVSLPLATPWILGGCLLVGMEVLADYGAVSLFNIDTLSTHIVKAWFGYYSFVDAARIALILVLVSGLFLRWNHRVSKRRHFVSMGRDDQGKGVRQALSPSLGRLVTGLLISMVTISFVLPVVQLILWAFSAMEPGRLLALWPYALHTGLLGLLAAFVITLTALGQTLWLRLYRLARSTPRRALLHALQPFTLIGYGIPGTVLAVGFFIPMAWLDNYLPGIALKQTLVVMLLGYLVRFLSLAHTPLHSAMARVHPRLDESALSLGHSPRSLVTRLYAPLLKGGTLSAFILIFVEVVKELPLTLMTRPFGWDTLAIKIFQWTSEGLWEQAALPSLLLIGFSLLPIFVAHSKMEGSS